MKEKDRLHRIFDTTEYVIFRFAFIAMLIAGFGKLFSVQFSTAVDFIRQNNWWSSAFPILASVVGTLFALISAFTFLLGRRFVRILPLKRVVGMAYQRALEKSSFNPQLHLEKTNERRTK